MHSVTMGPRNQIVIPDGVCEAMGMRSGQRMRVFALDHSIMLVPIRPMWKLRGFLKGMDVSVPRERDRQ